MVLDDPELVLAHGTAVGQGPIEGVRHAHAWCERTDVLEVPGRDITTHLTMVIDHSNGKELEIPAALYYKIGQISDVTRYSAHEMRVLLLRHSHYGPWD